MARVEVQAVGEDLRHCGYRGRVVGGREVVVGPRLDAPHRVARHVGTPERHDANLASGDDSHPDR